MTVKVEPTGIEGVEIELQPRFGTHEGAVLHMLPGGVKNPEGFGENILDIYASTAKGKGLQRGGHYHEKLDELFFTLGGTALWILSDFREESPTWQKTVGVVLGFDYVTDKTSTTHETNETYNQIPAYFAQDGFLPRLRVPKGVYHTYIPLTNDRVMVVGLGSTAYDKEDYRYPDFAAISGAADILKAVGLELTK